MRWIFILGYSFQIFASSFEEITPSSPEEIFSLTNNLLIEGFVSAASGQIMLSETDLHVRGAQDLFLKRTYIPPQVLGRYGKKEEEDQLYLGKALSQLKVKGWVIYPHLWAGYNRHSPYFQLRDPGGFVLAFEIRGNHGVLKNGSHGCSNLQGEQPSSLSDIRNIALYREGNLIKVIWPEGVQRHYLHINSGTYRLEKEVLSNGKTIRYEYNHKGLYRVFSSDPTGQLVYASITRNENNQFVSSDGRKARFDHEIRKISGKIKDKKKKYGEEFSHEFPVMTRAFNSIYSNTIGYNERGLLTAYDAKVYPISCSYFQQPKRQARIQTFSTPTGSVQFWYDPPIADRKEGLTFVTYPDGGIVAYRFNENLLLAAIENRLGSQLVNKKTFYYDDKQHIKSIETRDGEGNLLIAKRFECDSYGNPCLERTEGDCGVFSIRRTFDKNRLVFEDRDDGLQYAYTYLGDTWLLTSKTTFSSDKQLRKIIYNYDNANNLIEEVEENKTKTSYILYQTSPHLHRIEWEEKRDWKGQLIHKIHYLYDVWGNAIEEQFIDASDQHAYTIFRTYNDKGELLSYTNQLLQTAHYQYDDRGRCVYEEPISNGLCISRTFDTKGRLKVLRENDHETKFEYNSSDELIEKTNYLGYTTKYHHDVIHGKPDQIEEGGIVTKISYDSFGREREKLDANGANTKKCYNSYGELTKITHPEGGEETYTYIPNGSLRSFTDPDGLQTIYSRDALGRVTEQTVAGKTTFFSYDGYNLCKVIDASGIATEYKYDDLNRKIEEKRQNRITQYGYGPLGFLAWEKKGDRCIQYTHDTLGHLRKKVIDDVLEKSWTYDKGGNVASIECGGVTTFCYDSHNRLIETVNPEGYRTNIQYEKGTQLLLKKITDPMGILTVETFNPKGHLLKQEIAGQLVQEFTYDNCFRLQSQDHLTFGYTPNGNKEWLNEAGTRTNKWTYTRGNRVKAKQNPDGSTIAYEYDNSMQPIKIGQREFRYDSLNRLIGGTGFSRQIDAFGNVTREEWSNGLWIETDYDEWDRPIERRFPDLSKITYDYQGPFLKKITRIASDGREQYSHTYDQRNARGNILLEKGLFETRYEYDKIGRKKGQSNPYLQETLDYSPNGNLIRQGSFTYAYDNLSQMTSQSDRFVAVYDNRYNLIELNSQPIRVDSLNQIEGVSYDSNGNVLRPGFIYDSFNQLVKTDREELVYDALGRRTQQGTTSFLFIGDEEIGAFENGRCKELKISGNTLVAIELEGKPYAPIQDAQGTIRFLVDTDTQKIVRQNDCDVFGGGLTDAIPYAYAGKRYDPNLNLVYFGKRYYDPSLRRWLTPDPIGPEDHSNLYQYVFNNPWRYQDPNGEFAFAMPLMVWGAELVFPALSACVATIIYGAATSAVAYGGYKLIEAFNEPRAIPKTERYSEGTFPEQVLLGQTWKSGSIDPSLPANPDDLLKRPGWKETTHPNAGKAGRRTFENEETGEKLEHDQAKPEQPGHKAHDHYHRPNPYSTQGKHDKYLDAKGNPVKDHSDASHIYHPDNVWWN